MRGAVFKKAARDKSGLLGLVPVSATMPVHSKLLRILRHELLRDAAAGDVGAMCYLGYCYAHGILVDKDETKAATWYADRAQIF
jgi:TPR repeat protein